MHMDSEGVHEQLIAEIRSNFHGQITAEALAIRRALGIRLGRPPAVDGDLVARLVDMRRDGLSYRQIASALNSDGVPTAHGGREWHPNTVHRIVHSQHAQLKEHK